MKTAYNFGVLVNSGGRTPDQLIDEIVTALTAQLTDTVHREAPSAESRSFALASTSKEGLPAEHLIEINVKDAVASAFVDIARQKFGPERVTGRDSMIYGTLSGETDWPLVHALVAYAVEKLSGLAWDERSGFMSPE